MLAHAANSPDPTAAATAAAATAATSAATATSAAASAASTTAAAAAASGQLLAQPGRRVRLACCNAATLGLEDHKP